MVGLPGLLQLHVTHFRFQLQSRGVLMTQDAPKSWQKRLGSWNESEILRNSPNTHVTCWNLLGISLDLFDLGVVSEKLGTCPFHGIGCRRVMHIARNAHCYAYTKLTRLRSSTESPFWKWHEIHRTRAWERAGPGELDAWWPAEDLKFENRGAAGCEGQFRRAEAVRMYCLAACCATTCIRHST